MLTVQHCHLLPDSITYCLAVSYCLTLPLANILLTVWAGITIYCLTLSLANSELLPETVISSHLLPDTDTTWLSHLLTGTVISRLPITTTVSVRLSSPPGTVISWLSITARHCHNMTLSLTAWHYQCPTPNYCQTLSLPGSATYCLAMSFLYSQLLPNTVTAWLCHLM